MSPRTKYRCKECGTVTGPNAYTWSEVTPAFRTLVRRFCDVKCYLKWYKETKE